MEAKRLKTIVISYCLITIKNSDSKVRVDNAIKVENVLKVRFRFFFFYEQHTLIK